MSSRSNPLLGDKSGNCKVSEQNEGRMTLVVGGSSAQYRE